jgi:hypothetical protein
MDQVQKNGKKNCLYIKTVTERINDKTVRRDQKQSGGLLIKLWSQSIDHYAGIQGSSSMSLLQNKNKTASYKNKAFIHGS